MDAVVFGPFAEEEQKTRNRNPFQCVKTKHLSDNEGAAKHFANAVRVYGGDREALLNIIGTRSSPALVEEIRRLMSLSSEQML